MIQQAPKFKIFNQQSHHRVVKLMITNRKFNNYMNNYNSSKTDYRNKTMIKD